MARPYPGIKQGTDGWWHSWITMGTKANGRPDQRHVKRRTRAEVEERVEELLGQRRTGTVTKPGRAQTFQQWLTTWLDVVAPRRCDPTTIYGYRSYLTNWVYPACGRIRLDRLTADHLDAVYTGMQRAGKAESTILKVHRILSRALKVAWQRGLVAYNPASKLGDPPTAKQVEITPLTEAEALQIIGAAERTRNAARWTVGLSEGLRQGEALGLRWPYVDFEHELLHIHWQLHRRTYEHGCDGGCGKKRGGDCPERVLPLRSGEIVIKGALVLKPPKGKGKRSVPLPPELAAVLRAQQEVQELEKMAAGAAYADHGLVFADELGEPIDPGVDHRAWKALLKSAGVRPARVHDARHTAATMLLAQGVRTEVIQEILGHTDIRTTRRYEHVASAAAADAVKGLAARLITPENRQK